MSISRVQGNRASNGASSATTVSVTLGSTVGSGNIVTASLVWQNSSAGDGLIKVTDDKNNNYRLLPPQRDATNGFYSQCAYAINITNSPQTITGTISASHTGFAITADEFTGFTSSSLIMDGYNANIQLSLGTGTDNIVSGSITTSANGNLVVGYTIPFNGNGDTHGTGFTLGYATGGGNAISEWQVQSSAGSIQATFNNTTSTDTYYTFVISFKVQTSTQTYYVSPSGSDSNSGTSSGSPWAAPTSATSRVNTTTYNGGDQVLFQAGQTFSSSFITIGTQNWGLNPDPSSSNPITFGSYGGGANPIISVSGSSTIGFASLNIAGLVINGIDFTGPGIATGTVDGVQIQTNIPGGSRLDYLQIINCNVSQFGGNGLNIWGHGGSGGATSGFSNVLVSGGSYHDCTGSSTVALCGVRVQGVYGTNNTNINVHITNVKAYNNTGASGLSSNWSGSGIVVSEVGGTGLKDANGNTCGGLIELCEAYSNGANSTYSTSGPVGIFVFDATNVYIQFCESHSNHTGSNADGGGFDLDGGCSNCVIQYCYSHDNDGPGFQVYSYSDGTVTASSNCTVRYSISQNDGSESTNNYPAGMMIGNDAGSSGQTGIAAYNNTVYASKTNSAACVLQGANIANITGHICNNIFDVTSGLKFIHQSTNGNPASLIFDGNNYTTSGTFSLDWNGTTYTSLASWQSAVPAQEPHSGTFSTASPSLTNAGGGGTLGGYVPQNLTAYRLIPGSAMVDAGLNLTNIYSIVSGSQDFYGNGIPNQGGYNVGADGGWPCQIWLYRI